MFPAIFFIYLAGGIIFSVSGLDGDQQPAYEAAFKCTKAGVKGVADALRAEGREATPAGMVKAGCMYNEELARCVSQLDRAIFSSPVPNIAHAIFSFAWQHMVLSEKAGLCKNMKYGELREIALDSGILKKEHLVNIEKDEYKPCAGDVMRRCMIDDEIRMKQKIDHDALSWIHHYLECFEDPSNNCSVTILQHFINHIRVYEKYLFGGA